jgi:hypothetical protein
MLAALFIGMSVYAVYLTQMLRVRWRRWRQTPSAKRRTTGRSRETPSSPTTDLHSGQFLAQPTSVAICCADYWLLLTTDRLPFPPSLRSQSSTEAFQFPGLEAQ